MAKRVYEIWSEGYAATGNFSGANFHGRHEAESFKDACKLFFKDDPYYNPQFNTYWSCRLYDNEQDARKTFG